MVQTLPSPGVLLSPITVNEAVLSSRIEGTQATLDEVLEYDAGITQVSGAKRGDIEEIANYRVAVSIAEQALLDRPLTLSLIREIHQRLMQGVRGRDKAPGAFRIDQNWIGRPGDTIERARFVPPSPLVLQQALEDWEAYTLLESEDPVIQVAVAHAQFEILHPFKDGNGRVGRMLIPLLLYRRDVLSRPVFYLSEYLESNRDEYYDKLLGITKYGDWQGWLDFFMRAVQTQAEQNLDKVRRVRDLYDDTRRKILDLTHSQYAMGAADALFTRPIVQARQFADMVGFTNRMSANNMLRALYDGGVLIRIREGSGRSPAIYGFRQLLNIVEGRSVF